MDKHIKILVMATMVSLALLAIVSICPDNDFSESSAVSTNEPGQTFESGNLSYKIKEASVQEKNGSVFIIGLLDNSKEITIPLTVTNGGLTYDVDGFSKNIFFNESGGLVTTNINVELYKTNSTVELVKSNGTKNPVESDESTKQAIVYSDAFGNSYFKEQLTDTTGIVFDSFVLYKTVSNALVVGTFGYTGDADHKVSMRLCSESRLYNKPAVDFSSASFVFFSANTTDGGKLPALTKCTELCLMGHSNKITGDNNYSNSTGGKGYKSVDTIQTVPNVKSIYLDNIPVEPTTGFFINTNTCVENVWIGSGAYNVSKNNLYSLLTNSQNLKTAIVAPGNQFLENDAIGNVVNKTTKAIVWEKPLPFEMTVAEGEITPGQLNFNVDVTKKIDDGLDDVRLLIIAKYGFGDNSGIFTNLTQKVVFDVDGKSSNVVSVSELGLSGVSVVLINGAPMGEFKTYGSWEYPDNKGA